MDALLEVQNVGVRYTKGKRKLGFSAGVNEFWAVKDVSLVLNKGDVLGIIGKNGAGKSTLMSLFAGIIDPDRGSVTRNYKNALLLSLQAGFMPYLSGRKNLFLSGLLLGYSYDELRCREEAIIEFSGIRNFIDEPVCTYSSGMKARLGFAICIHLDPDLILMDEVLGVGDRDFKAKSKEALETKISGASAIIVSHDEKTLKNLCNKVLIVNHGVVDYFGETEEAIKYYRKA